MKKVYLMATIMAIVTGFAVYMFANTVKQEKIVEGIKMVDVVVCIADIPENTVITGEMVAVRQLPAEAVIANAAKTADEVVGRISKYPIFAGEQLLLNKFSELGSEKSEELSYELKEGQRAITVPVDEIIGVAGFIKKGDYVDIISTVTRNDVVLSFVLLENIKVLKTGNKTQNLGANGIIQYTSVTLCLTSDEAVILSTAMADSVLRITLRPMTEGQ